MGISKLLLCTDLDRTLIPNGPQPQSPEALELFRQLVSQPEVALAYVTGRHQESVEGAIAQFDLPTPNFLVADVGATLYQVSNSTNGPEWHPDPGWEQEISDDWRGKTAIDLQMLFQDVEPLQLQETSKQNRYKLSYYVPLESQTDTLTLKIEQRLQAQQICANLTWSVDEAAGVGLLDILPQSASKRQAVEFLMTQVSYSDTETVFAGDSGNDMSVLISPIRAVVVANARPEVKQQAQQSAVALDHGDRLYIAQGDFLGMNGNYSAGILEGVAHYLPEVQDWLTQAV